MRTPRRQPNIAFPHRLSHYENDEGLSLLAKLAERRGVSVTALLRLLTREEAQRVGATGGPGEQRT